jgi:hypothetical protein
VRITVEKRAMTGAGLPPIAIEAVLKLLAIGQESAKARKIANAAAKPNLRLELTPNAASFQLPLREATARAAGRAMPQRRRMSRQKPDDLHSNSEGAESC